MKKLGIIGVAVLALGLGGCTKAYQAHPGSVNTFDSVSYDSVLVAHSVIESTKTDLANGVFPATIAPKVKTALNDLVASYNIADSAYQAYHAAAVAGTATTSQANAVTSGLAQVGTATAALTAAKAGK